ncbi:MAG: amidohydrolase [Emergencia timonensis]|uniref:amidohydrolase n=1 Tax=Emergencia timonensis TaxID=1776384 RepID=UPI00082E591A|nr:amidohydrolase [Emergencia timonensis]WNX86954.1 amidohydrolase [Emergencia timonensis]
MEADIIIKNGKCMTMKNRETADWLAIKDGRIAAIGGGNQYEPMAEQAGLILDAKGGTVLPGFIDSHFHVVQTAINSQSLDLREVCCFEEIGEKIRQASMEKPGESIIGIRLEVGQLREGILPDRLVLDQYCSNVPVWINSLDYQVSMLNTYGLLYFKIPFSIEGVEMDSQGVATGIFRGKANATLRTNILDHIPDKERREAVSRLMPQLLSTGITTINAMEGGNMYSDKDADFIYEYSEEFPVDIALFYQSMDIEKIKNLYLNRIGGSLYIDGTMGARTAALSFEYADCPGRMGSLRFSQPELNEFVTECYRNNMQLSVYTIGDRAIEMALNAHEFALYHTGIRGLRHRLEHVELSDDRQMERAAEMGIIFSMNPTYEVYWGGKGKMYEQRLGERYVRTNCFREIIDSGVCICGGSDSDITEFNPLIGISAAINHQVEYHRASVYETLEMYTCNGAYAIFEEEEKGTLEVGKLADVIILDGDIMMTKKEKIQDMSVLSTIKSGELIYNRL